MKSLIIDDTPTNPSEATSPNLNTVEGKNEQITSNNAEIEKLNVEETPEFQNMIVDALFQIKLLEQSYEDLKQDLLERKVE